MELDVVATTSDERVLVVEVRKRQSKSTPADIEDFQEKVAVYQAQHPEQRVLAAFLALGGFTEEALQLCQTQGIAWATKLLYF